MANGEEEEYRKVRKLYEESGLYHYDSVADFAAHKKELAHIASEALKLAGIETSEIPPTPKPAPPESGKRKRTPEAKKMLPPVPLFSDSETVIAKKLPPSPPSEPSHPEIMTVEEMPPSPSSKSSSFEATTAEKMPPATSSEASSYEATAKKMPPTSGMFSVPKVNPPTPSPIPHTTSFGAAPQILPIRPSAAQQVAAAGPPLGPPMKQALPADGFQLRPDPRDPGPLAHARIAADVAPPESMERHYNTPADFHTLARPWQPNYQYSCPSPVMPPTVGYGYYQDHRQQQPGPPQYPPGPQTRARPDGHLPPGYYQQQAAPQHTQGPQGHPYYGQQQQGAPQHPQGHGAYPYYQGHHNRDHGWH
ncbi:uncharacterized protein GGS25DRAFT_321011 [Hypoxylon fragiforme]|uniref:uncharacterized protein n=1 Tax=Hypoxylon fragiforme TaxID=63214 RepID=UPI0020C5FFA0|nr:uncharacterized protein GGS25DRAFT_321011 [Hypoxylon fragiforme]KAI2607162.1 hypothetical protein GGS25DRAFT_321011 [Hypoxylon fragiforme]